MRRIVALMLVLFICGCSFVVVKDDKVKTYGMREGDALDLLDKIKEKAPEEKHELWKF